MSHQVTSPLVVAKRADGTYVHVYQGGTLPEDVDAAQLEQLVASKMVTSSDEKPAKAKKAKAETPEPDAPEQPAGNASHDEWVAYAVSQGVDQDEAEAKSRDELRDLFK
jgi:topoisomerase IA-like protein